MIDMAADPAWEMPAKLAFAAAALRALAELHAPSAPDSQAVIHRALTPESVRVRADGRPLFAGWRWARLPEAKTITGAHGPEAQDDYAAPEVQKNGLAFADARSDVYSLCKVLRELFTGADAEVVGSLLRFGHERRSVDAGSTGAHRRRAGDAGTATPFAASGRAEALGRRLHL